MWGVKPVCRVVSAYCTRHARSMGRAFHVGGTCMHEGMCFECMIPPRIAGVALHMLLSRLPCALVGSMGTYAKMRNMFSPCGVVLRVHLPCYFHPLSPRPAPSRSYDHFPFLFLSIYNNKEKDRRVLVKVSHRSWFWSSSTTQPFFFVLNSWLFSDSQGRKSRKCRTQKKASLVTYQFLDFRFLDRNHKQRIVNSQPGICEKKNPSHLFVLDMSGIGIAREKMTWAVLRGIMPLPHQCNCLKGKVSPPSTEKAGLSQRKSVEFFFFKRVDIGCLNGTKRQPTCPYRRDLS